MLRVVVLSSAVSAGVTLGVAVLLAVWLGPLSVQAEEEIVRARAVAVVGEDGTQRLLLRVGPGIGAGLDLLGDDGTARLLVQTGGVRGASRDSASLNIFRTDGTRVIRLGIEQEQQGGRLILEDRQGRPRLALALDDGGNPLMTMWDEAGNLTWSAP